ncbi:hypothetical protein ACER0A_004915 [Haloimpatiens sp. FM7315]|uniref:hypothetical protein n=1 Tax=Haloimpatiens sp. FM7315 TaxID=3298609 RepID=UPI00370B729F
MKIDECIKSLDYLEMNRKADYSIWGYLYQFDLALYDMLCHGTEDDLFNEIHKGIQVTYQIEVIEDYIKNFTFLDKKYVRLAQVKYSSTAKEFNYWNVIIDLYYDYLYLSNHSTEKVDIKCGLFFNTVKKIEFCKNDIEIAGKKAINDFIELINKAAMTELDDDTVKGENKDNHLKRVIEVINKYHSDNILESFLKKNLIISWTENRLKLINLIKEKLDEMFKDELSMFSEKEKKDILYSVAINFIINEWQSKKKKKDIRKINISDVITHIKEISDSENNIAYNLINSNIMKAIEQVIEEFILKLKREGKDDNEIEILLNDSYYKYADKLFEKFSLILKDKSNRYKLVNTISMEDIVSEDEYYKFSLIEEYGYLSTKQPYLKSYIKRILKFIDDNVKNKVYDINNISIMLNFETEIILFEHPYEKRTCVLLPKTYDNPEYEHGVVFDRIIESNIKPKVWYFDNLDIGDTVYDLDICKPEQMDVDIKEPYNNHYYIECMECLNQNNPFDNSKVNCIFCERCNKNGQDKNRTTFD